MALALTLRSNRAVQWLSLPLQLGFYIGLFIACDRLVSWLHLPLPANIVGMLLLLALIVTRIVPLNWVKAGSRWLLAEMLLFFVPAMLVVTEYPALIRSQGLQILAVIVLSTACVMAVTAFAVDRVYRLELRWSRRQSTRHAHQAQAHAQELPASVVNR